MPGRLRIALGPIAIALLIAVAAPAWRGSASSPRAARGGEVDGARYRLSPDAARRDGAEALPPAAPLRFAPATAASDRQVVLDAIARARPQARRLVELVAGLVTVSVGSLGPAAAGRTTTNPAGYDVALDLGPVYRRFGARGVSRVTLHELGHVVDHALVPGVLERRLDAATPPGYGCDDGGLSGACAVREERFAESFAKWATGDIGADLYLGYRVPPPYDLAGWGAPLAALAR